VEDWFLGQPSTFTRNNIKFKPNEGSEYDSKTDSVHSDIDIIAVHLDKSGEERVSVVSCKSWQSGFNPQSWHKNLTETQNQKVNGKETWKSFRELFEPKWSQAFREKVFEETKSRDFTYYIAVTKLVGNDKNKELFEMEDKFIKHLNGDDVNNKVKIKIITFSEIFEKIYCRNNGKTIESTNLGRLIQVMKASRVRIPKCESGQ
jgi:hypothetical protein